MWASLYTPVGKLKYEKLNYRITKLSTLLEELLAQDFSGYVEILAPHEHGLIVFCNGRVYNCFYEGTEDLELSRTQIIEHFLRTETTERETIINVAELDPQIITALSALESRTPAHRELETVFLDMGKLFETFARKKFTGNLRFYRIRNNTRLGNILLRLEKITAEQLRDAIRLQLSGEGALRLGDALKQIGAIDEKGIEEALDRQNVTRKGSDLELALAVFHAGEFLGGYRFSDKALIKDKQEVIKWLAVSEILMDIIDGALPQFLDVKSILHPDTQAVTQRKESAQPVSTKDTAVPKVPSLLDNITLKKPGADSVIQELTHETFMLKADDLILDIHPHPSSPVVEDEEAADKNLSWLDELVSKQEKQAAQSRTRESKPAIPAGLAKAAEYIITTKVGEEPTPISREKKPDTIKQEEKPGISAKKIVPQAKSQDAQESTPLAAEKSGSAMGEEQTATAPEASVAGPEGSELNAGEFAIPEVSSSQKQTNTDPGLAVIQSVVMSHMGFLGQALIDREKKQIEIPEGRAMSPSQIKSLNQRLFHTTSLVVGEKTAERIMIEIENEIGG
ncbi:hypothetical protein K8S19_03095 [bacterium]|nr:hypothetical protein [bacterium]